MTAMPIARPLIDQRADHGRPLPSSLPPILAASPVLTAVFIAIAIPIVTVATAAARPTRNPTATAVPSASCVS